ncbi:MAG: hypothetical protein H7Y60_09750 [Rhodospirillaceae bacterium]|nr:hypothetical protein [Rhodospirillales bacterium]
MDTDTDLIEALGRLVKIAKGDTGQSRTVANFLLAWWNANSCGGFDLTDLWAVDTKITKDILAVTMLIAARNNYPDAYGFKADFERMVADWRPHLLKD